jgi:hypothetical protein
MLSLKVVNAKASCASGAEFRSVAPRREVLPVGHLGKKQDA